MGEFLWTWLAFFIAVVFVIGGSAVIIFSIEWLVNKLPVGSKARDGIGLGVLFLIVSFIAACITTIDIK